MRFTIKRSFKKTTKKQQRTNNVYAKISTLLLVNSQQLEDIFSIKMM